MNVFPVPQGLGIRLLLERRTAFDLNPLEKIQGSGEICSFPFASSRLLVQSPSQHKLKRQLLLLILRVRQLPLQTVRLQRE